MTNREILMVLNTAKHNLDKLNPPPLQKVYLRNAQANVERIITDLTNRIKKEGN